jgi:hypothetical protein
MYEMFEGREPVGIWDGKPSEKDYILTRIMWLEGLDTQNANTKDRYIYIHGTNQEQLIGTQASHGCVRMLNKDVLTLFNLVQEKCKMQILQHIPPQMIPSIKNYMRENGLSEINGYKMEDLE